MTLSDTSVQPHLMPVLTPPVLKDVHKGVGLMDDKVTYHQQISFCGQPRCRKCREGIGHGPYWYSYQVVDGRTIRPFIGKSLPPGVQVPPSQKSPTPTD